MVILTLINSFILILILFKPNLSVTIREERTFSNKTLLGWDIILWKSRGHGSKSSIFNLRIPIRNRKKTILKEDINRLIQDKTNQNYTLNAMFSWLKTEKQVLTFKKDYQIVNPSLVNSLVDNFFTQNNK